MASAAINTRQSHSTALSRILRIMRLSKSAGVETVSAHAREKRASSTWPSTGSPLARGPAATAISSLRRLHGRHDLIHPGLADFLRDEVVSRLHARLEGFEVLH